MARIGQAAYKKRDKVKITIYNRKQLSQYARIPKQNNQKGNDNERIRRNAPLLFTCHPDWRHVGAAMIKITFYSIDLGAEITNYGDGTWDLDCLHVLDSNGRIYEELPAHMLTERADHEINELIESALNEQQPDSDGPADMPDYPTYIFRSVKC